MSPQEPPYKLPRWLMPLRTLTAASKLVWSYLRSRQGRNAYSWPAHSTIARDTGLSVATVKRSLEELTRAGHLTRYDQAGAAGRKPGKSCRYVAHEVAQNELPPAETTKLKMSYGVAQNDPGTQLKMSYHLAQNELQTLFKEPSSDNPTSATPAPEGRCCGREKERLKQFLIGIGVSPVNVPTLLQFQDATLEIARIQWGKSRKASSDPQHQIGDFVSRFRDATIRGMLHADAASRERHRQHHMHTVENMDRHLTDELKSRIKHEVAIAHGLAKLPEDWHAHPELLEAVAQRGRLILTGREAAGG